MKNNEPENSPVINPLYQESGNFFLKGQIINILGLASNTASASTLQFCFCSMKAGVDYTQTNGHTAPTTVYKKQAEGWMWPAGHSLPSPALH